MLARCVLGIALLLATACSDGGDDTPLVEGDTDTDVTSDVDVTGNTDTDTPTDDTSSEPEPSTVPADPATGFNGGDILEFAVGGNGTPYWVIAPNSYDKTHQTPAQLFVYLHGCGGASESDVLAASNADAGWVGMAPGGAEGLCWDDQNASAVIIMAAIADVKTHYNIDPKRIHIGGYSSGGDQSYYTAFRNASSFAGVLSYNSTPAYSMNELNAAIPLASWKFNIVHLSQTGDLVYPIADVREIMQRLRDTGFPVTHIERPGLHYDDSTTDNRNTLVYPHLYDGWRAP